MIRAFRAQENNISGNQQDICELFHKDGSNSLKAATVHGYNTRLLPNQAL
jgi:hypothetical protein